MTKPLPPEGRLQSLGEEIANSLSSGIGLMAVIAGIPLLVGSAIQTAKRIQSCRRDRFRSGDGDAVPYIDNLSRIAVRQDQASFPSVRSLGNLPSDCRHLYP